MVREFPLVLRVNDREIATLVASPHDLRFLVAGFLRLQGFVSSVDDFLMLSVCNDFGVANVRIRGELPETLKPILTTGCGTGITFSLPTSGGSVVEADEALRISPAAIFALMAELARKADSYKSHGGIHSAAVGELDGTLILFAEDVGRHNTIDRLAGEALLRGVNLAGKMLVTSGRVSAELAVKAARLGLVLVASRTSPTDVAIRICTESGIALVGYVRGGKFSVYAHHQRITSDQQQLAPAIPEAGKGRIPGVTGVILAGGASSRMGSNKALLPYRGGRFIEAIYRQLAEIFDEVILVTNNQEQYAFLPCRKVADIFPGMGALAGIHSGLTHSTNPRIFAVACDMPCLNSSLVRHIASLPGYAPVIIPKSEKGLEPLHAVYGKECLPVIEDALRSGEKRIIAFFDRVEVRLVEQPEIESIDPSHSSFLNINTPEEYYRMREDEKAPNGSEDDKRGAGGE